MTGGRERTREEFGILFSASELQLTAVTPSSTLLNVIEAAPE
jgi:hypothetical protein